MTIADGSWEATETRHVGAYSVSGTQAAQAKFAPVPDFPASENGNVTTVGTNGGASAYGAFDMSGNVSEWNDLTGAANSARGVRGGFFTDSAFYLSSSSRIASQSQFGGSENGFRLAAPVPVPEPSTWVMGLAAIACGGYSMFRGRKRV